MSSRIRVRYASASQGALAVALLVACAGIASAQTTRTGVRAGVNFATLDTSSDAGAAPLEWQFRPVFSGFLILPVAPWLVLQPEVAYALKGTRSEDGGTVSKVRLDYLEVPILGRFSMGAAGTRRFHAVAGAALSVLLRARTRVDLGDATEELDISEDVETLDWGLVLGGGVEAGSLVFDARYTHGLRDIDRDATDSVTVRNRAVSISAGIRF